MEEKMKSSFQKITPEIWASVQEELSNLEGGSDMNELINNNTEITTGNETKKQYTNKKNSWRNRMIGLAAALVLFIGAGVGFSNYQLAHAVDSTISLDVNPSIEITTNAKEDVLNVTPLNEDGKIVIGSMDFAGSNLDVTVNALIGSMIKNGYIDEVKNSILVTVNNGDQEKGEALKTHLSEEIQKILTTDSFQGAVLSQTVTEDKTLQTMSEKYGITLGKAQLIKEITDQSSRYDFEDLVSLSINELNLISNNKSITLKEVSTSGTASDKGYIGETKAKSIALKHAGTQSRLIKDYESEMDYEKGLMVYEIEFTVNGTEYSYDINAIDGTVVKVEKEVDDDHRMAYDSANKISSQQKAENHRSYDDDWDDYDDDWDDDDWDDDRDDWDDDWDDDDWDDDDNDWDDIFDRD